jgi:hypothetical protein
MMRSDMRGSTLLLHRTVKPLIMLDPTPKRPSPVVDCRPRTVRRLAAIAARLLLFIDVGGIVFCMDQVYRRCQDGAIGIYSKRRNSLPSLRTTSKSISVTLFLFTRFLLPQNRYDHRNGRERSHRCIGERHCFTNRQLVAHNEPPLAERDQYYLLACTREREKRCTMLRAHAGVWALMKARTRLQASLQASAKSA